MNISKFASSIKKLKKENPNLSLEAMAKTLGCSKSIVHYHLSLRARQNQVKNSLDRKARGQELKLKLIKKAGGQCKICKYDRFVGALEFHHTTPEEKSFPIGHAAIVTKPLAEIMEEVKKCILICSNCHREIHYSTHNIK